jgi:hypothetical protein
MRRAVEAKQPEIGHLTLGVYGSGRRSKVSHFELRCNAIGLHDNEMLLLSVVGAETAVKALVAGLRAADKAQRRIDYSVHVGDVGESYLRRCPNGYRILRSKLPYGLWHILALADRPGFMSVMTEEAVWQHLQDEQFTTPLVREWTPWLYQAMKKKELLVELTQSGCQAGILLADNTALDELVSDGIKAGHLAIDSQSSQRRRRDNGSPDRSIEDLDQYLLAHGALLGKQAERSLQPLHVPERDSVPDLQLNREPFAAQIHIIEAARKALRRQKALMLVGEMGTGKTIMGMAAIHAHASGRPYRALVFCPGQLVHKWEREIKETIPGAEVVQIESWKSLLQLNRSQKPAHPEYYIISRDRAKLGAKWQPAICRRSHVDDDFLRCPHCGLRLVTEDREPLQLGEPAQDGKAGTGLWKQRVNCEWVLNNSRGKNDPELDSGDRLIPGCGSALWQMTSELRRYEPATYIKRHLRHFFDYLILDEVHEEKGFDTAQGHAAGALAASCRKVLGLTGTLIGGYAEHLRPLLFRLAPSSLVQEGLGWSQATAFNERYGRIETRITERSGVLGEDNRMSRGSKSTTKSVRPGIMPVLFGKHLIDKTVFLSLGEVADNLPPLQEECISVKMDKELATAYQRGVEEPLALAIKTMMVRRDRRLLGTMVQALLAYPDYPFAWGPIGYWDVGEGGKRGRFVSVTVPPDLSQDVIRPKERALIDLVRSEKAKGRKCWVYVQYTDKHDVESRLEKLLKEQGFQVGILRASVPLGRREEWIAEHAPKLDVVISHPRLVETGLDLFDKNGAYNFSTICFYETGYNLFTLRQASRRSWRIGQTQDCRIVCFYYEGTMQDRAMALMGRKLTAAQALEGTFSSEGLVALAGEDANVELALARSLVERMDEGDARRMWSKVVNPRNRSEDVIELPTIDQRSTLYLAETPPAVAVRRPRRQRQAVELCAVGASDESGGSWLF